MRKAVKQYIRNPLITYVILSVLIGLVVAYKAVYLWDPLTIGCDTDAHIYKVWLLTQQIKSEGALFWGSWDWNWYGGYPFLKIYPPLFFFLTSLISLIFQLPPSDSMKVICFMLFPLSSLTMFLFIYRVIRHKLASLIGAFIYVTIPRIVTSITLAGGLAGFMAYSIIPLVLLFIEKLVRDGGATHFVLATLCFSALSLAHLGIAVDVSGYILLLLVLRLLFVERFCLINLLALPASILVAAFYIVPAVYYGLFVGEAVYPLRATAGTPIALLAELVSFGPLGIGIAPFIGMIFSLVLFIRRYKQDAFLLPYLISTGLAFFQFFSVYIIPRESVLSGFTLWHGVIPLTFLSPILCSYAIARMPKKVMKKVDLRKVTAFIIVSFAFISFISSPIFLDIHPKRYADAWNFIRGMDDEWFNVLLLPRTSTVGIMPMYLGKPTIDGWFRDGAARDITYFFEEPVYPDKYRLNATILYVLRVLNVKYVIVDSGLPNMPGRDIYLSFKKSSLVETIYEQNGIAIFRLKEVYPLIASTKAFVITEGDELATFYDIMSNKSYVPSYGVFLARDNNLENIKWTPWAGHFSNGDINLTIYRIEVKGICMNVAFTVDRESFIVIPVAYYPLSLEIKDNGSEVKALKALPSFICLHVAPGYHEIEISRIMSHLEMTSLLISASMLSVIVLIVVILKIGKVERSNIIKGVN